MAPLINFGKSILARLKRVYWINFAFDVFARFGQQNGGLLAAGLAFFLVLAIVPLLLVGLWGLGLFYIQQPDKAVAQIHFLLAQALPGAAGDEVGHLMARAGISQDEKGLHAGPTLLKLLAEHGIAGVVGFLGIVWASMQIFVNGSVAMNAAWETKEHRGWVQLRLVALGLLVAVGVLLVMSLAATTLSKALSDNHYAKLIPFSGAINSGAVEVGAVILSGLMYSVIFKFLPAAKVSWKAALMGGFVSAVAFEIANQGLSALLLRPNKSLYGELGNLIALILWIYYSMMILLIGATVSALYAAEVEGGRTQRLKRAASSTPSAESDASSGSPLARSKERNRANRIRKSGR